MKAFELNHNSWHYRLGAMFDGDIDTDTDLCSYIRYVLGGAARTIAVGVFGIAIIALVAAILYSWGVVAYFTIANLGTGAWYVPPEFRGAFDIGVVIGIVVAAIGALFGIVYLISRYQERARQKRWALLHSDQPPAPPTFSQLAYRRFKDKTCVRVTIS